MTTPAILAYVRPGPTYTGSGYFAMPDFTNNLVYLTVPGTTTAAGFAKFNGYTDDSDLLDRAASTFPPVPAVDTANANFHVLTYQGYLVFFSAASNFLWSVRASDFSYTSGLTGPGATNNMVPLGFGSTDYVLVAQITFGGHSRITYIDSPALVANTTLFTIDEVSGWAGRGAYGASTGTAFVIGHPSLPSGSSAGLYKVSVSSGSVTHTKSGTFLPSDVDATWSTWATIGGLAYDQLDGNVITTVGTTDAVTNKHYLVKLNAATSAVMWAIPIAGVNTTDTNYLARCNITAGTLYYLSGTTLYTVNTSAGTATSATIGTLTVTGGQISDDVSTSILLKGTWAETSTTPTYLGTFMGDGGNHALASQTWIRYFPAGVPPAPPPPPPPDPPFPIVSVNRAWTYDMDGHTFYVLDLGAEGTFVYDLDSKEWSNFQTNGSNWSMVNGCMFGDRVVGGDLATTDVWEMVPSAGKDSGSFAYEIAHVVTGGLTQRSRTYLSVANFRITASFGQLDDPAGVNFTLQYSDDLGQTWTTPDTIALAEGDYTSEIVWRSLGAFASPGRIFQLSDSGGLVRIDGADASIENFDEDDEPQKQA